MAVRYTNQDALDYAQSDKRIWIKAWHPWEKRFAFLPTIVNGKIIWMKTFYSKDHIIIDRCRKHGTILDVLKDGG